MNARQPKELKILKGTANATREREYDSHTPTYSALDIPSAPASLGYRGKEFWERYAKPLAEHGVIKETDWDILLMASKCRDDIAHLERLIYTDPDTGKKRTFAQYARERECSRYKMGEFTMLKEMNELLLKYLMQLGLTPATRGRVAFNEPDKEIDAMESMLSAVSN